MDSNQLIEALWNDHDLLNGVTALPLQLPPINAEDLIIELRWIDIICPDMLL